MVNGTRHFVFQPESDIPVLSFYGDKTASQPNRNPGQFRVFGVSWRSFDLNQESAANILENDCHGRSQRVFRSCRIS